MSVFYFYVDESYDRDKFVLSALMVPDCDWRVCFDQLQAYRRQLKQRYGLYIRKELHAQELVKGKGNIAPTAVGKHDRSKIFHGMLQTIASLPKIQIFNICLDVRGRSDPQLVAWDRLVNRVERTMRAYEDRDLVHCARATIVADEGREAEITKAIRKMHVFNPIPSQFGSWGDGSRTRNLTLRRIIEDPVFKASHQSFFLQSADCIAFALLKREVAPTPHIARYGIHRYFDKLLAPVCFHAASNSDPLGIVRG